MSQPPLTYPALSRISQGDTVTRILSDCIPMTLKVSEVTKNHIHCGDWKFCRKTGAEIDEELGWGPNRTGSFILPNTKNL